MVMAAVRGLGLPPQPNVSFPRGLKSLLRFGRERYAVIDVGTNSVKFHLGERGPGGRWRKIADRAQVTRLGEGLHDTGRLNPEPMARTTEAISRETSTGPKRCGSLTTTCVAAVHPTASALRSCSTLGARNITRYCRSISSR